MVGTRKRTRCARREDLVASRADSPQPPRCHAQARAASNGQLTAECFKAEKAAALKLTTDLSNLRRIVLGYYNTWAKGCKEHIQDCQDMLDTCNERAAVFRAVTFEEWRAFHVAAAAGEDEEEDPFASGSAVAPPEDE